MAAAGCESIASIEQLSVMGFSEVLPKLRSILALRSALARRFAADRPDCTIGIDAPDFNLALETRLRGAGLRTVHVVSPTVWAWRPGRVKTVARAADLLLCLLPFEVPFYAARQHDIDRVRNGPAMRVAFIGHPLADELAQPVSREAARAQLGLPPGPCVAVLPGSRGAELKYLGPPFVQAAAWLAQRLSTVDFVVPIARPALRPLLERAIAEHAPQLRWHLLDGQAQNAMRAADAVLLASGTATLECLLLDRPMVVSYRASALNAALVRALIRINRVSLPNLLCGRDVVPELLQEDALPEKIGPALLELLNDGAARERQTAAFAPVRRQLQQGAGPAAAAAIAEMMGNA
jgi:lipid-A-disaccharide synthase